MSFQKNLTLNKTKYMKKKTILIGILSFFLVITHYSESMAQAYSFTGPVAVFTYDNVGNRVKREIRTMCVGIGCPPEEGGGSGARSALSSDDSIGAKLPKSQLIEAYPNPAEERLFVRNPSWHENDKAVIVVYDVNSKVVIKKEVLSANEEIPFDKITPGQYMVQYYLNNSPAQLWKIIKP